MLLLSPVPYFYALYGFRQIISKAILSRYYIYIHSDLTAMSNTRLALADADLFIPLADSKIIRRNAGCICEDRASKSNIDMLLFILMEGDDAPLLLTAKE